MGLFDSVKKKRGGGGGFLGSLGALGGAALGQVLIPIPGVGAALGGAAGGALGSGLGGGNPLQGGLMGGISGGIGGVGQMAAGGIGSAAASQGLGSATGAAGVGTGLGRFLGAGGAQAAQALPSAGRAAGLGGLGAFYGGGGAIARSAAPAVSSGSLGGAFKSGASILSQYGGDQPMTRDREFRQIQMVNAGMSDSGPELLPGILPNPTPYKIPHMAEFDAGYRSSPTQIAQAAPPQAPSRSPASGSLGPMRSVRPQGTALDALQNAMAKSAGIPSKGGSLSGKDGLPGVLSLPNLGASNDVAGSAERIGGIGGMMNSGNISGIAQAIAAGSAAIKGVPEPATKGLPKAQKKLLKLQHQNNLEAAKESARAQRIGTIGSQLLGNMGFQQANITQELGGSVLGSNVSIADMIRRYNPDYGSF